MSLHCQKFTIFSERSATCPKRKINFRLVFMLQSYEMEIQSIKVLLESFKFLKGSVIYSIMKILQVEVRRLLNKSSLLDLDSNISLTSKTA